MKCEACNKDHTGSFASGRFCSKHCALSFATRAKRKIINKQVSSKLLVHPLLPLECPTCNKLFIQKHWTQRVCSLSCSPGAKDKTWKVHDTSRMGGPRPGGGRSKALLFVSSKAGAVKLNKDEIRVAKVLDKLDLPWQRNTTVGFAYITRNGVQRKFYPDFVVNDVFIEYKGWITPDMHHKMHDAQIQNPQLKLIIITSERFKAHGISIELLEQQPQILLRDIHGSGRYSQQGHLRL